MSTIELIDHSSCVYTEPLICFILHILHNYKCLTIHVFKMAYRWNSMLLAQYFICTWFLKECISGIHNSLQYVIIKTVRYVLRGRTKIKISDHCINPSGVNAAIVKQQSHVTCTLMCEGVQRWCVPATDRDGKAEPSCWAAAEEGARRSRTLSHPGANEWAENALGQPG